MNAPYQPPKSSPSEHKEFNVRGGYFTDGESEPVECIQAWVSPTSNYYRVKYVPRESRRKVATIFTCVVLLTMLFGVFGGLGHLIVYYVIKAITYSVTSRKVEFDLIEEDFLMDRAKGLLGIRKIQNGKPVFIGCKPKNKSVNEVMSAITARETNLQKESKLKYRLFIVAVSLVGLIVSALVLSGRTY